MTCLYLKDKWGRGGLASLRALLTPSLRAWAVLSSILSVRDSVAAMISWYGICLGAMAKDMPRARAFFSSGDSNFWLRFTTGF